jgi:hypothetical protein
LRGSIERGWGTVGVTGTGFFSGATAFAGAALRGVTAGALGAGFLAGAAFGAAALAGAAFFFAAFAGAAFAGAAWLVFAAGFFSFALFGADFFAAIVLLPYRSP